MSEIAMNGRSVRRDDNTDSFASTSNEFFSGALASELGITNAIIIRKLELINTDNVNSTAKEVQSCIPDNQPEKVLYNYIWRPLDERLSKTLYYINTVTLMTHLQQLCRKRYLYCKHVNGKTWYAVNYSKLNRLYDISKFTD